jgi:DNA-binding transcriptional regulator YhcF (GntR family)
MNGMTLQRVGKPVLSRRRRHMIMAFEMVRLDRNSAEPLYQQLYRQICEELESGNFDPAASRLPSSRALAESLGISRLTVNLAFSKLLAEGYIRSRERSGIFVAERLPTTFLKAPRPNKTAAFPGAPRVARRIGRMTDNRTTEQLSRWPAPPHTHRRASGGGRVSY